MAPKGKMGSVLAFDPGYERLGAAVVGYNNERETLIHSECITTSASLLYHERLAKIGAAVESLVDKYKPTMIAIETLYFSTNQKTAMQVAGVRGVLLYIGARHNLRVFQYTPLEIKIAVTGYGKSTKKDVTAMVHRLVSIKKEIAYDDEYDAIAIGLTCLARERFF